MHALEQWFLSLGIVLNPPNRTKLVTLITLNIVLATQTKFLLPISGLRPACYEPNALEVFKGILGAHKKEEG